MRELAKWFFRGVYCSFAVLAALSGFMILWMSLYGAMCFGERLRSERPIFPPLSSQPLHGETQEEG